MLSLLPFGRTNNNHNGVFASRTEPLFPVKATAESGTSATSVIVTVMDETCLARYSTALGFCIGCFVQFSTLGGNLLILVIWGAKVFASGVVSVQLNIFGVAFSVVLSLLTTTTMVILRHVFSALLRKNKQLHATEEHIEDAVAYLGFCFVVGSVVGSFVTLLVAHALMVKNGNLWYSLRLLIAGLVWSRLVYMLGEIQRDKGRKAALADAMMLKNLTLLV